MRSCARWVCMCSDKRIVCSTIPGRVFEVCGGGAGKKGIMPENMVEVMEVILLVRVVGVVKREVRRRIEVLERQVFIAGWRAGNS